LIFVGRRPYAINGIFVGFDNELDGAGSRPKIFAMTAEGDIILF